MTTPNPALVRLDDGTDRTAVGPVCYFGGTDHRARFAMQGARRARPPRVVM